LCHAQGVRDEGATTYRQAPGIGCLACLTTMACLPACMMSSVGLAGDDDDRENEDQYGVYGASEYHGIG
jgi:hypothetical protein